MSKSDVFHLGLTKNDLQGATLAIVPGDPERVEKIAALMDKPVKLASHREFTSWRAELDGKPVIVCSTGIGGPSTSIAVEELAQLGVRTFLRIGILCMLYGSSALKQDEAQALTCLLPPTGKVRMS